MKKLALSLGLLFFGFMAFTLDAVAQTTPTTVTPGTNPDSKAQISFEKEVHDYGNIKQGGNGECEFKFTNTGTEPLVISDAKGSCGCTVPEWPKTPIKPGESATIKVKYDTKRNGAINKTVTVTSNSNTDGVKMLRIKGNVEPVDGGGAPLNNSGGPVENK